MRRVIFAMAILAALTAGSQLLGGGHAGAQISGATYCGEIDVSGGQAISKNAADPEECFYQSFLGCTPAILTVQFNPLGDGGFHRMSVEQGDHGCLVVSEGVSTFDSEPNANLITVVCLDLGRSAGGLAQLRCSGGPPLIIPALGSS